MRRLISALTLGTILTCGSVQSWAEMVVINEIMYHPRNNAPEYIELYNQTATPFDIAQWRFTDGVDYEFPAFSDSNPPLTFLYAFERIVVSSTDAATTRAVYGIPPAVKIYGPWSGNLSDGGERITLKDKNGVVVCTVQYGDRGHWPVAADGTGHSLTLKNSNRSVDDWRNWTVSKRPGGTPGTEPVAAAETPAPSPEINVNRGIVLVDYNATWRYENSGVNLGTDWLGLAYDDSSWPSGPGLLGEESSALPNPGLQTPFAKGSQLTHYFRAWFTYNGDVRNATLILDQIVDDGAVYYLNGVEIGRSGVGPGEVTFDTTSNRTVSNASEELNVFPIDASALVKGQNLLAVEVHQTNPTSSDIVFGCRLGVIVPVEAGVVINELMPGGAGTGFVEFYNPTATPINLRNYYLSDDAGRLNKYVIAKDIIVPASGFGSAGLVESSFASGNPPAIYLTSPDGATVITAVRGEAPGDGRSLGRKPSGSSEWFLFTEPSRNQPNASQESLSEVLRINETHFTESNTVDWIELYNSSSDSVSLDGLHLASRRDFSDRVEVTGQVAPRGFTSVDVNFPTQNGEITLYLINSADTVVGAHWLSRSSLGDSLQAFPDGNNEWYGATQHTRNQPNNPNRNTDIVINEIMYDPPSDQADGEYIELHNRGQSAVDISGWRFTEGINFIMPQGTIMPAGGYLAVAANSAQIKAVYGGIPVVGNFQGRLNNRGELIRLVDQWGNLVNEVDYKVGGDWPILANGSGSSMELLHPSLDNQLASAWADSDEANRGQWRHYTYGDVYRQLTTMGGAADYKELHFHLANDGHVILNNIMLRKDGAGPNLIANVNQISINSYSATGWLCQGTHCASFITNGLFHVISDGRGDNKPNRVEIDVTAIEPGNYYELSFDARWVSGTPRLIAQTWDHSIASSFRLEIPETLGTPGRANSRLQLSAPPQVDELLHSPPVPRPGNAVRVTARVAKTDSLSTVALVHRLDNSNANGVWTSKPMYDNGVNGGDETASDGVYTATLTEYSANGQVVQFYVQAQSDSGLKCAMPREGAARPAMFVIDNRTLPTDLRLSRFVISAYDLDAISSGDSSKHGYKFPRLSNHYFNATFICNEQEIYYGAEIRNTGSPWTRGNNLDRGKFKLPDDRRFRSHYKLVFDNDPTSGRMYHNRITRHMLYLLGHAVNENEFVRIVINTGGANLREEVEPVANDFLDRNFENGSLGDLYRIDDEWWFTDSWSRRNRDADWMYKGTDNSGRYRTEWMKRTNETDDDFSALINFFKTVTENRFSQAQIERLIDPYQTMMMVAVRGYISDWDFFSLNRGKNGYFYRRYSDGLFQFMHWDSDLAFGNASSTLVSGVPGFPIWFQKSYNRRIFNYYLAELIDNYTRGSARMNGWLDAEEQASSSYSIDANFYRNWFNSRQSSALNTMGANYTRAFGITSNGGQPFETEQDTVLLAGIGPCNVMQVIVEGHPEAKFTWYSDTTWTISDIRLKKGANILTVNGVDQWGKVLRQDTISITKTNDALPVVQLVIDPASLHVLIGDVLKLDAQDSIDPDGSVLSFNWSVYPSDYVVLDTNKADKATVIFNKPGLFTLQLNAVNAAGRIGQASREAAVYSPSGFSSFKSATIEGYWRLENAVYRANYPGSSWVCLEPPGQLSVQVLDDSAKPLAGNPGNYPFIWRSLPSNGDWIWETRVRLLNRQYGDFICGLLVETIENGNPIRYAFGLANGTYLAVERSTQDGAALMLRSIPFDNAEVRIRIRRIGNSMFFDQQRDGAWIGLHFVSLAPNATTSKGGLFLATSQSQSIKAGFDYALLIDPSNTSDLRENLRPTELMYNPVGDQSYEYIELTNIGTNTLDLTGIKFTEGIYFTFGSVTLDPQERIVVVKDQAAFASRYGSRNVKVAAGEFSGKLDNGGEKITLVDADDNLIFSFTYGDSGAWPGRADGFGSALEIINPIGDLNDPDNWRSSSEYGGSPGEPGTGPMNTVVINEVLAHSDLPFEDAIELHNLTDAAVNIGGWYLSDSRNNYKSYRIPAGTIIQPKGYWICYEYQFNTNNILQPFALSSVHGDEVYLVATDSADNLMYFVDKAEFGASENAVSFGRYPNGTGPLVAMSQLTFGSDVKPGDPPSKITEFRAGNGAPNAEPRIGPVVISQIMYHPPAGGDEYIELRNISSQPAPLYDPAYPANTWSLSNAVAFSFPQDTALPGNGKLLVVNIQPSVFRAKYSIDPLIPILGPYTGSLDNAGETVELLKPDLPQTVGPEAGYVPYILVEKVRYNNRSPWPVLADGYGPSLKRIYLNRYANDPANWSTEDLNPNRDSDGDGMPDLWELDNGLDPLSDADAVLDPDGDGMTNLHEFWSGTNPQDPLNYLRIEALNDGNEGLLLRFIAVAGKAYSLLYKDSFTQGAWTKLRDVDAQAMTREMTVTDPSVDDSNSRFYRIVTTALP